MTTNKPLVSIITVTYNAAAYIESTLDSILNQSYTNIELIVIDGASTDGTLDIIKGYGDKVTHLLSEPDKGVFDAMNKGIRLAKGKWLNFMNAGDSFVDAKVLDVVMEKEAKNTALLYGNRIIDGKVLTFPFPVESLKYGMIMACHQAMFFNKTLLGNQLIYDTSFPLYCEFELVAKLYKKEYPFQYVDYPIVDFLSGGISSKVSWEVRKAKYTFLYRYFGITGIINGFLERLGLVHLPAPIKDKIIIK